MTVHRFHPDNEPHAILYPNCDRCEEHASDPTASLDNDNLAALWAEMIRVEDDPTGAAHYRNGTEGRACRALLRIRTASLRIGAAVYGMPAL